MQNRNIFENFDINRCCGCGNCINSCPKEALSFSKDEEGFIIPKIDNDKCVGCSACINVCPYTNLYNRNMPISCFGAVNNNPDIIFKSSSGGIFYELASYVLKNNGVVYGAALDDEHKIVHIGVEDEENVFRLMKSKYVQSYLGAVFSEIKKFLEEGRMALFSGTPCQVSALKKFLRKDYKNLYTVDVVCHGVPNQQLFDDYWAFLERKGKIKDYTFRAKKNVQNGMNSFISYEQKKVKIKNWLEDSYYYYFMNSYSGRRSCYGCAFGKESHDSDLTLCDFWGWEKYHTDTFAKNDSVSGIVINSDMGLNLFGKIKGNLKYTETRYDWLSENNKSINRPNVANEKREWFFRVYLEKGYPELDRCYRRKTFFQRFGYKIKRFIRKIVGRC